MRDPVTDPLLTPQNSALLVIDYQPSQIQVITSIDHDLLIRNIVSVARLAMTYGLPVVLSTVNVAANGQPPTIPELREILSESVEIDRTQINSFMCRPSAVLIRSLAQRRRTSATDRAISVARRSGGPRGMRSAGRPPRAGRPARARGRRGQRRVNHSTECRRCARRNVDARARSDSCGSSLRHALAGVASHAAGESD